MNKIYSFYRSVLLNQRKVFSVVFAIAIFLLAQTSYGRKIHNRQYRFKITMPETMKRIRLANDTAQGQIYYDSVADIGLIISWRESKFHKVDEYINCSWKELESILKDCIADTSLRVISCSKKKRMTILDFIVSPSTNSYQNSIIYFVHHKQTDIQFSFVCKKEFTSEERRYMKSMMRTLKLK